MRPIATAIVISLVASAASAGSEKPASFELIDVAFAKTGTDWTGGYAGLQFGKGEAEISEEGRSENEDFDGYGLHAGYLRELGGFVVGGEFDYNAVQFDDFDGTADLWRLRGRIGYGWNRFLPYLNAGVAHLSDDPGLSETDFTYGLGVEFKVSQEFTVGTEFTHQSFDVSGDYPDSLDVDLDLIQFRGSLHF